MEYIIHLNVHFLHFHVIDYVGGVDSQRIGNFEKQFYGRLELARFQARNVIYGFIAKSFPRFLLREPCMLAVS